MSIYIIYAYLSIYCRASHTGHVPRVAVVAQKVARLLCCCVCFFSWILKGVYGGVYELII